MHHHNTACLLYQREERLKINQTMSSHTLLTLPREIRDMVYGYLCHDVRYLWPWQRNFRTEDLDIVDICIDNAPCTNALLINRKIQSEYQESLNTRRYLATIATKPLPKRFALVKRVIDQRLAETAVSQVRVVHILILNNWPEHPFWTVVGSFVELLVSKAPRLQSLQIGTQLASPNPILHRDVYRPGYWETFDAATHPMFHLQAPPPALADDFTLRIRGEGYQLTYVKPSRHHKILPRLGEPDASVIQHSVARVGAYAFAKAESNVVLMDKEIITEQWTMPFDPEDLLCSVGDEWADMRSWPHEIQDWKMRCGNHVDA
jgi:hypothetical protein